MKRLKMSEGVITHNSETERDQLLVSETRSLVTSVSTELSSLIFPKRVVYYA